MTRLTRIWCFWTSAASTTAFQWRGAVSQATAVFVQFFAFILLTRSNCGQTSNSFNFFMYSAFSLHPLISFAPSCNVLRIYSSSFSSDACLHLLVWFCCSFEEHGYNSFTITINYSIPSKQDDFYYIYIFHQMIHNKIVLINRNQSRNTTNFSRQFCPV